MKIKGLIAAPFTPFNPDGEINLSIVEKQAEMYKLNNISGVFICGTTGESSALTVEEKKDLFREWSKYKTPDFCVIAFLGGTSVKECKELALFARKCGVDAISLTAPYYFKPSSVQALADYCSSVAASVPEMPFYYYHIPSFTGVFFPMIELLQIMDRQIPNLAGIKYTYENLMDYQLCLTYKDQRYDILWGRDEMLLSALAIGAQGAVGSTYGYLAPVYQKLIQAYQRNEIEEARKLQMKAISFIELLNRYGGGTGKAFMSAMGLNVGKYRQPVTNLSDKQWFEFNKDLDRLDFKSYCNLV